MAVQIQIRRGSAAAWTAANPLLAEGETGYETDTGLEKIGNGVDNWNTLPYRSRMAISAGANSRNTGTVAFSNSNGITFGLSNNGMLTASHNGLTSQSNQAFSAEGGSSTFQTLSFENANGITFSNNGGAVRASYTVPTQTAQSIGLYASSQTTGESSSSTVDARSLSIVGAGIVSVGLSAGSLVVSATGGGGGLTNINVSAGTTSNNLSAMTFANGNGITFGLNASTITASHNGLTSQSNQAVSAANGSYAFQTLSFSNANGISFGTSAGSAITASYTVPTQSNQSLGIYALGNTTGQSSSSTYDARTLSMEGAGIASVGWSNGSLRVSATQSNQALSGSNGSFAFQTATFGNLNGLSFYTSNGSMVGSYTVPTQTNQTLEIYALGNTTGQSSRSTYDARTASFEGAGIISVGWSNGSLRFSATQSNQTLGGYAVGNTTQSSSGTIDARSLSFRGEGVASVGVSNGSVVVSVPAGGGGITNVNLSAGTTSQNLSAFVFSNSNNVSFGLNGSTVTARVDYATMSLVPMMQPLVIGQMANGNMYVQELQLRHYGAFNNIRMPVHYTQATGSTLTVTVTYRGAIYTFGSDTDGINKLFSLSSTSYTMSINGSGTASSASNVGPRWIDVPWTLNLTRGDYYLALIQSTNTAGANASFSNLFVSEINSTFSGHIGSATNSSGINHMRGIYSATTNAFPATVTTGQIRHNATSAPRQPAFQLFSTN